MNITNKEIASKKSISIRNRLVFDHYGFFFTYDNLEDRYVVILSLMDQCRILTEETVKFIRNDKKVYKNNIKHICNKLYNPSGNTVELNIPGMVFKGWTRRIETKILSNMNEDAQTSFAIMNGELDDLIKLDLVKFNNAVSLELAKHNFNNKDIVNKVFRTLFFADMCRFIIEQSLKKTSNDSIFLVKECREDLDKRKAFRITTEEVTRIYECLIELTSALLPKVDFEIPDDSPVGVIIDVISRKLISPYNIYKCAEEAGLDLRRTSNPSNFPETIDAVRESKRIDAVSTKEMKRRLNEQKIKKSLDSLKENTGWKVEIAS